MGNVLITPKCRLAFVFVDSPREYEDSDPRHEIVMIFDKEAQETDEFKAMEAAVDQVIADTWPKTVPKKLKTPFKTAEDYEDGEGNRYKGFEDDDLIAVRAAHEDQPGRVDRDSSVVLGDGDIYSGCWARCAIDAYSYDKKSSKGVTFGLGHIQKLGDGTKLGGQRPKAKDVFGSEVQADCTTLPEDDGGEGSEDEKGEGLPF